MKDTVDLETRIFRILRWLTICLVFYAIPSLLICFWFNQTWAHKEENRKTRLIQRHENLLASLSKWGDTVFFFRRIFKEVSHRIAASKDQLMEAGGLIRRLKHRFPESLEFLFVNQNGEVIPGYSDWVPPKRVLKKFFSDLQMARRGNIGPLNSSLSLYKSFLGPLLKMDEINRSELFSLASYKTKRSYVYLSPLWNFGMVIVFFHRTENWDVLPYLDRIKSHNRRVPRRQAALIDAGKSFQRQELPASFLLHPLRVILAKFSTCPENYFFLDGHWWFHKLVTPSHHLLTFSPDSPNTDIEMARLRLLAIVILFFGILSWLTMSVICGKWLPSFSIRTKLIFLFMYSVGLPLAVMGITAGDYFSELRRRLENQTYLEAEKSLTLLDKKFPQALGILQNATKKIISQPLPGGKKMIEVLKARVRKLVLMTNPSEAQAYDEHGNPATDPIGKQKEITKSLKSLKPVLVTLIKGINQGQTNLEEAQNHSVSRIAAVGGVDFEALLVDWARGLGTVKEFKYGIRKAIQGFFPVYDQAGTAKFLLSVSWTHFTIQMRFLRMFLPPLVKQMNEIEIFCFNQEPDKPDYRVPHRDVPANFRHRKMVEPFITKLLKHGGTLKGKVRRGSVTYLLTGIHGDELNYYFLIAVSSDRKISKKIARAALHLKLISLTILLIAFTVGSLLAKNFLEPVGHLTSGVLALRNRDFSARLPIMDQDELGELSNAFNAMMESMEDLEVARIVQESLFPTDVVNLGPFGVYGTCIPAAQVGGDYFDYFPLSDDRLVVLIGDVSGHGVPAALIMAMAKATVENFRQQTFLPSAVMETLNLLFLKIFKRKRMMTFFLGIIDLSRDIFLYSNAGHNFPYVIRGGKSTELEFAGLPLGGTTRMPYRNLEIALLPGDTLVLYTDGIVESYMAFEEMIGYRRFIEALCAIQSPDAPSFEREVRQWHKRTVIPGPQDDDITLVVIRYSSGKM